MRNVSPNNLGQNHFPIKIIPIKIIGIHIRTHALRSDASDAGPCTGTGCRDGHRGACVMEFVTSVQFATGAH